jgi:hypothetical protein
LGRRAVRPLNGSRAPDSSIESAPSWGKHRVVVIRPEIQAFAASATAYAYGVRGRNAKVREKRIRKCFVIVLPGMDNLLVDTFHPGGSEYRRELRKIRTRSYDVEQFHGG